MIVAGAPAELQLLTLVFCVSGAFVLPVLVWRARRRPATAQPPFAKCDPAILIGVACLVFAAYGLCLGFTASRWPLSAAAAATAVGIAIAYAAWAFLLKPIFLPRGAQPRRVAYGLLVAWASLPLVYGLSLLVQAFGDSQLQQNVQQLSAREPGWMNVAVSAVVLAPVFEELIFRGFLYPAVRSLGGPAVAITVTAVLFGLVHWTSPLVWGPMTVFGVFLAYLVESTGSLLPSIVAHAAFNSLTVVQLLVT